jgi:NOL1/NOP2/fmu family ribosome biogenesis protein
MNMDILTAGEKKKIVEDLNKNYGFEELPLLLVRTGKGKLRAFSGSLSMQEIKQLGLNARIETIGLYAFREEKEGYRISHDSVALFKNLVKKNIVEVNDELAEKWLQGKDIESKEFVGMNTFVLIKNKDDLIGCGIVKHGEGRIINFVPKERRMR